MTAQSENGCIRQDATVQRVDKLVGIISTQHSQTPTKWQDDFIATKYHLPSNLARLVCDLQGYGRVV